MAKQTNQQPNSRPLTAEQLKGLQARGLEIAVYFRDFCNAHHLRFFLCGGCCIGSQRNGGFIPWDDDVDVFMPRPDYEKLAELWPKEADTARFGFQAPNKDFCTRNQFATIHHNQTTFIKSYQQDLDQNHGIMLDILPIDGCPTKPLQRRVQKIFALLYALLSVEQAPENHGGFMRFAGKALLFLLPTHRLRFSLCKWCEKQMSKYHFDQAELITELCSGPGYMQKEYPAKAFREQLWVPFCGEQMPIPCGFDTYLSMAFGDYMTPPPPEKQVIHHDYVKIDPDTPYTQYRGTHYALPKQDKTR